MPPVVTVLPEPARAVIARTAAAWNIAPDSPRAVARRAPHGYVSARARRRRSAGSQSW